MLLSERQERERRFKLALRAGVPVLLLISLVFYTLFVQEGTFEPTLINGFLISGIIFITIYFNYFLIDMSVKETMVDSTTQSFNEKAFIDKLEAYKPKTLILLIVDNLYTINENYSAQKVDMLLYTIIHKLDTTLTQYGLNAPLIGRRYGAEFLIALDTEGYDVEEIFKKFVEENKTLHDIDIDYRFSAVTDTKGNIKQILGQLKDLIASPVDERTEKNENVKKADELNKTEKAIIEALNLKQFKLSFRPLKSTQSHEIDIYEIVAKMMSNTQGEILPRVYLPIINRLDLGVEYDLSLVEHIIKLLPLVDEDISFTFNLSPFSLRNKNFQEKFFALLETHQVKASRLIIQLYERKSHHDLSGYFKTLSTFRANGIRICIDNFGSSNASMEYMKNFKFDMVQFDRDYVTNLNNPTNMTMLSSLVTMSKELNIQTVAKWVDNDTQKNRLTNLGIDYLQGFGIDKPLTEQTLISRYN
jgi:EAL domain-containing protein (putative c-di-GMP-specific phosphodiesterase class I)/GGDEF domain-containing protein